MRNKVEMLPDVMDLLGLSEYVYVVSDKRPTFPICKLSGRVLIVLTFSEGWRFNQAIASTI